MRKGRGNCTFSALNKTAEREPHQCLQVAEVRCQENRASLSLVVPDAKAPLEIMALAAFPRVCQSLGCPPLLIGVSHEKGPPLYFL